MALYLFIYLFSYLLFIYLSIFKDKLEYLERKTLVDNLIRNVTNLFPHSLIKRSPYL